MNRSRQHTGSGMIYRNDHADVLYSRTVDCGKLPEDAGMALSCGLLERVSKEAELIAGTCRRLI